MSLRFHELAEQRHRILNPFTDAQLDLLGEICGPDHTTRQIDLCCGKGEMLSRWSDRYGLSGTGVDISPVFLAAARARAAELGVTDRIEFAQADASTYPIPPGAWDIVSCIGATWIGGGLRGTIDLLRGGLRDRDSLLLIGEPYWITPPPDEAYAAITGGDRDMFLSLPETHARIEASGFELIEMVLADHHGWDRYSVRQWQTLSDWLRANPDDPDAAELREWHVRNRRDYLSYTRPYLGWGVFVLRQP